MGATLDKWNEFFTKADNFDVSTLGLENIRLVRQALETELADRGKYSTEFINFIEQVILISEIEKVADINRGIHDIIISNRSAKLPKFDKFWVLLLSKLVPLNNGQVENLQENEINDLLRIYNYEFLLEKESIDYLIQLISKYSRLIPQPRLESYFFDAAVQNHAEIIQTIDTIDTKLKKDWVDITLMATINATIESSSSTFNKLLELSKQLKNEPANAEDELGQYKAAYDEKQSQYKEFFKSLNALLAMNGDNKPSQNALDKALQLAVEKGSKGCVEALLDTSHTNKPSQKALDQALQLAVKNESKACVEALLATSQNNKPSQNALDEALQLAVKNKSKICVKALLVTSQNDKPSQKALDQALELAGQCDSRECAAALLVDRSQQDSPLLAALNVALKNAIDYSNPYFFKEFMQKCHICMLTDLYATDKTKWEDFSNKLINSNDTGYCFAPKREVVYIRGIQQDRFSANPLLKQIAEQLSVLKKEKSSFFSNTSRKKAKIDVLETLLYTALKAKNNTDFCQAWESYRNDNSKTYNTALLGHFSKRTSNILQSVNTLIGPFSSKATDNNPNKF